MEALSGLKLITNQPASLVHLVVKVEEVEFMKAGFLAPET
jgi:hypothetical protein